MGGGDCVVETCGGADRGCGGRGGGCGIAGLLLLLLVSKCLGGALDVGLDVDGGAAYVGCRGWKKDRMDGCTRAGVLACWSIALDFVRTAASKYRG